MDILGRDMPLKKIVEIHRDLIRKCLNHNSNSPIINYSTQDTRRVDIVLSIEYNDDLGKVGAVLANLINSDERIISDPEFQNR